MKTVHCRWCNTEFRFYSVEKLRAALTAHYIEKHMAEVHALTAEIERLIG